MADLNARVERVIEELTGNEALLQMLETEAATEMLNWGIATAKSMISKTIELDDFMAELAILPRLKAIRQSMRSIGNWAAANTDPLSRANCGTNCLDISTIFGEKGSCHLPKKWTKLNQVDDKSHCIN
jgi:hypothetical protein